MANRRYKILSGSRAGEIHMGFQIGARFLPDGPVDWSKTGDRVWIPKLKESFRDDKIEVEDLVIPFDKYEQEIFVGDILFVAVKRGVVKAQVLKLNEPYHMGCGWRERQLQLMDIDTNKKFIHNHPYCSIKVLT